MQPKPVTIKIGLHCKIIVLSATLHLLANFLLLRRRRDQWFQHLKKVIMNHLNRHATVNKKQYFSKL